MDLEKLREVRSAYKERKQLEGKIIEFESMRVSPRGTAYGKERVQTSVKGDIQAENLAKIEGMLERYNELLRKCLVLIEEFETCLELLNSRERRMMRLYYIDGLTWEQVCVEMDLSWMHVSRIRKKIIEKISM